VKKIRKVLPIAAVILLGVAAGVILALRRDLLETGKSTATNQGGADPVKFSVRRGSTSGLPPEAVSSAPETTPSSRTRIADTAASLKSDAPVQVNSAGPRASASKEPARDSLARDLLAYVGLDSDADGYWLAAINDPSLSAQERQNLIEDLNEAVLSDPRRPTLEDLPLILARLELIEALEPEAMDSVNAAAFREAYRDLMNLADVAMGGGRPVR